MSEARALLEETTARLLEAALDRERRIEAEQGVWLGDLWRAIESTGLTRPNVPEALGGAGGDWRDAYVVARACGRHGVPLPVVETILATWLLGKGGIAAPAGPLTLAFVAVPMEDVRVRRPTAALERVPFARHCGHVVVVIADGERASVALADRAAWKLTEGQNLALEPRDHLDLGDAPLEVKPAPTDLPAGIALLYGAMLRSAQMAGALETILDLSVRYAGERVQFGRPIGQFQAIQQDLARLAGFAAAAGVASESAFRAADEATAGFTGVVGAAGDPTFEIAAAKVVAGEGAELGPRIAHQVHGAIGFTYEHRLQFFTRRLWSWRAELGSASDWSERLGSCVLAVGADRLWPLVTSR